MMHEFSLVKKEIEKLQKEVINKKIKRINFFLGRLAHGTPDSIREAFKIAVGNTPLSCAELDIITVEPKVKCSSCGNIFSVEKDINLFCAKCGSTTNELISGEECYIESVEIEN